MDKDIRSLSDEELWLRTAALAGRSRRSTFELVEALAVMDERRLAQKRNYASLHECCVAWLKLSDGSAYRHIRAARALRLFPPIGPALRDGRLTLESIALLHPHLEDADAGSLVASSLGKSVSEVERIVAPRRTEEPRRDVVRLIAAVPPSAAVPAPGVRYESRAEIYAPVQTPPVPAAPARHAVRIAFTADESFEQLLKEVQAAMRHKYPDGRLEGIFRDALKALLKKNRPWAFAKKRP